MTKARTADTLSIRDAEDLEDFAARFHSLSIHAFGMEPAGSPTYETPSFPPWLDSYSSKSAAALARSIWRRLLEASVLYAPAATVLMALHSPAAVQCDGVMTLTDEELDRAKRDPTFRVREKLDVGRRLAVYPCTWTADEARRWRRLVEDRIGVERMARGLAKVSEVKLTPGPKAGNPLDRIVDLLTLDGRRPTDILRAIADAKRVAKGNEGDLWREIDREAAMLIGASVQAWNATEPHRVKRQRQLTDRLVMP